MPCLGAFGHWGFHKGAPRSVRHIYSSLCHWERLFCQQETRALARLEFRTNKFTKCPQKVLCESLEKAQREAVSLRIPSLFYCLCQIVSGDIPLVVSQTRWLSFMEKRQILAAQCWTIWAALPWIRPMHHFRHWKQSICWLAELTTCYMFVRLWPDNSRHIWCEQKSAKSSPPSVALWRLRMLSLLHLFTRWSLQT